MRLQAAWLLAIVLSGLGVVLSILKGLEIGTATLLLANFLILLPTREAFYRRSSIMVTRLTAGWWVTIIMVLAASIWLLLFSYQHVQYRSDLWWQVELNAQASRSLRTMLATSVVALFLGMLILLRPAKARPLMPTEAELSDTAAFLTRWPDHQGWIGLTGDKNFLWNQERTAFLMYAVKGYSWVCLGEPIGERGAIKNLLWDFMELVDAHGGHPAFYQVGPEYLADYLDLNLHPFKLGETAFIPLQEFSLVGGRRSNLRASCNKSEKAGASFCVIPPEDVPAVLNELEAVSNQWLAGHNAREKRFSLGFFDRSYLVRTPVAVVRLDGKIVAFANLLIGKPDGILSIDLMRHAEGAPNGTMDFLLVQILLEGKKRGYRYFDLGMAPLSGIPQHHLAGNWAHIAHQVTSHAERFYNFNGLRSYKEKFDPDWQPRYLLCKSRHLLSILLDISSLISGGVSGLVRK